MGMIMITLSDLDDANISRIAPVNANNFRGTVIQTLQNAYPNRNINRHLGNPTVRFNPTSSFGVDKYEIHVDNSPGYAPVTGPEIYNALFFH